MIKENIARILEEIPPGVEVVAATKSRSVEEIREAIAAGIGAVGENYIKEAEEKFGVLGNTVKWHMIGHLQKNKVRKAVRIFDLIETVDSLELAGLINTEAERLGKTMPILIEVNSGREAQKQGVLPEQVYDLCREIPNYRSLKLAGLMTMGPQAADPEQIRSSFRATRELFGNIRGRLGNSQTFRYLSMGMSGSYRVAIEEGANIIRLGTILFGPRTY
jgi:pyridoxal phosphate enzyme (YggS family)